MPTALITGGTSGIGLATAKTLHSRGYQVAVTGESPERLALARSELPPDILALRADSASLTQTEDLITRVTDRFQAIDALFLNAGITRPKPVGDITETDFEDLVNVNFKGQFFTLQKALPILRDGASVVFNVGIGARRSIPGGALLCATKGALLALLPTLALELAPRRIRVNSVSPGAVETPIWDKLGIPADVREGLKDRIPLGRVGTADDVAEAVAFLFSDRARFITGEDLVIGGGAGLAG